MQWLSGLALTYKKLIWPGTRAKINLDEQIEVERKAPILKFTEHFSGAKSMGGKRVAKTTRACVSALLVLRESTGDPTRFAGFGSTPHPPAAQTPGGWTQLEANK